MSSKLRDAMGPDGGCIQGLFDALRPRMRKGENAFEAVQRMLLSDALEQSGYEQVRAAELLGVTQVSVSRRCRRYWPGGGYDTAKGRGAFHHGLRSVG